MTIVQLEYIVAIDTHRSFNRAAKNCFVTQPTLSLQVQKLEDLLGVKIFDRNQNPVMPTAIGSRIIEKARLLLNDYKLIKEIALDEKNELSGELNIGVITTVAPYLIPSLMARFIRKHPAVKLVIWEETTEQIVDKLKSGIIDCGIISTPYHNNNLLESTLVSERFIAYVGDESPLSRKKALRLADISAADIWILNEGHCMRDQILNLCQKRRDIKAERRYEYNTGSLETLRRMVDENNGATILPETVLTSFNNDQLKKVRRFVSPEPMRHIGIITAKNFIKRKLVESLKREIVAYYDTVL